MLRWPVSWERRLQDEWSERSLLQLLLRPVSWIWGLAWLGGRLLRRLGLRRPVHLPVPVIVVGNISVGGSGKTPCVIALVEALQARGLHPGVVSRGHGGRGRVEAVGIGSLASEVGDEPLLIARRTGAPVWVGPKRVEAARMLCHRHPEVDVLVSDDGLQHWPLPRVVEIAVVDARRGLGNGLLLPAGPLREPPSRLREVDQVWLCGDGPAPAATAVLQRISLRLAERMWALDGSGRTAPLPSGRTVMAIAGIAAPWRFFDMLRDAGVRLQARPFADHHAFHADELAAYRHDCLLMTEKDAVKCASFAAPDWWVVPLEAALPASAVDHLLKALHATPTA